MDYDDFMVIIRYLLVKSVMWKALYYLDQIEVDSILFKQNSFTMNDKYSKEVKQKCEKIIMWILSKNTNFIVLHLTFSVNDFVSVFKKIIDLHPEEAV